MSEGSCSNLATIYADSTWALPSSGVSGSQVFYNCNALVGGAGTAYVSRNDTAPENGAPLLNKPVSTGIVEQEQKSVTAPSASCSGGTSHSPPYHLRLSASAALTSRMSAGTSMSGPTTAANASPPSRLPFPWRTSFPNNSNYYP